MEKMNYEEAIAELDRIVRQIEDPQVGIANIKGLIMRANELVAFCKKELMGYEEELSSLLEEK